MVSPRPTPILAPNILATPEILVLSGQEILTLDGDGPVDSVFWRSDMVTHRRQEIIGAEILHNIYQDSSCKGQPQTDIQPGHSYLAWEEMRRNFNEQHRDKAEQTREIVLQWINFGFGHIVWESRPVRVRVT